MQEALRAWQAHSAQDGNLDVESNGDDVEDRAAVLLLVDISTRIGADLDGSNTLHAELMVLKEKIRVAGSLSREDEGRLELLDATLKLIASQNAATASQLRIPPNGSAMFIALRHQIMDLEQQRTKLFAANQSTQEIERQLGWYRLLMEAESMQLTVTGLIQQLQEKKSRPISLLGRLFGRR